MNTQKIKDISIPMLMLGAATLVIYIMTLFTATNAKAQISIFPEYNIDKSADMVQLASGQPYYRHGRAYYYNQTHSVPVFYNTGTTQRNKHSQSRFCPQGQRKKGNCKKWNYKQDEHRNPRDHEKDNNGRWGNDHNNNSRWNEEHDNNIRRDNDRRKTNNRVRYN